MGLPLARIRDIEDLDKTIELVEKIVDKYQGNDIPEWSKMSKQDYKDKLEKLTARKWSANVWEQIAHELV